MATKNDTKPLSPYVALLRLVWRLRKAQKDAERYPSRITQSTRARLEDEVDVWLANAMNQAAKVKQMGMDLNGPKQES